MTPPIDPARLVGDYLCTVDFHVGGICALGASPWGERRVGYITGGSFAGPRLNGTVLPGGGNWSGAGRIDAGNVGTFDARAILRTEDGALIYMTYSGRTLISDAVRSAFTDPDPAVRDVDPDDYYLRIAPVFETAAPQYDWLNATLAVGRGQRTETGARHHLFAVA
jgi:hypothetical protein